MGEEGSAAGEVLCGLTQDGDWLPLTNKHFKQVLWASEPIDFIAPSVPWNKVQRLVEEAYIEGHTTSETDYFSDSDAKKKLDKLEEN
jgi:hypothetical protein